ncbi:hypothetical protein C8R43DRAFT_944124 [Mycena crocata]|nr:hypothetical protein C8R43DRAFT_944124 [Mycena crocata]
MSTYYPHTSDQRSMNAVKVQFIANSTPESGIIMDWPSMEENIKGSRPKKMLEQDSNPRRAVDKDELPNKYPGISRCPRTQILKYPGTWSLGLNLDPTLHDDAPPAFSSLQPTQERVSQASRASPAPNSYAIWTTRPKSHFFSLGRFIMLFFLPTLLWRKFFKRSPTLAYYVLFSLVVPMARFVHLNHRKMMFVSTWPSFKFLRPPTMSGTPGTPSSPPTYDPYSVVDP